jgi:hypothetical protein
MSAVEHILQYQKKYRLVSHLLFWVFILLVGVSSSKYYDGREFTLRWAFIGNGIFLIPQIIGAYFLSYLIIPAFFDRKKYALASAGFIAGVYLICLFARFLIVRVAEPLAGVKPKAFETNTELIANLPKLIYVYFFQIFCLAFVFLFIKLLIQHLYNQQRTLILEKEKIATELKLLKSQLNPHFLFNTLNNIYALSLLGSPVTSSSIGKLAEILDHILYHCDSALVPLSGEIALLNNYLELERLRYNDRLQLNFTNHTSHDPDIPPLILLSLAENAFKHGASQDIGQPVIEIDLHADQDSLRYSVSNSLVSKPIPGTPGKIGLPNLKKQLELLYPGRFTFTTGYDEKRFRVLLILDLKKAAHEDPMPAGR